MEEEQKQSEQQPKHAQPKHKKHWLGWLLAIIILILALGGGYEYHKVHKAASKIFTGDNTTKVDKKLRQGKPITIVTMGLDSGLGRKDWGSGNTDSIELITVNPKKQTVRMTAIPRDTLVKVKTSKGSTYVKLNAAYSIGGPKQTVKQIEELLGVKVDYYASLNMNVLKKVVNAVGGVTVDNSFAFDYEGHHFKKGKQTLNGDEALKYSRMRYEDPRGDYGRQYRQQQILQAVIKKFMHSGSITAANKLLEAAGDGVRTNLPVKAVATLYTKYSPALNNTQIDHLQGMNATIDGASFQIATPTEINRVSKAVHQALGQSYTKVSNTETRLYNYAIQEGYDGVNNVEFPLPDGASYNTLTSN